MAEETPQTDVRKGEGARGEEMLGRELARQLATLTLTMAAPTTPDANGRAIACRNVVVRLGIEAPKATSIHRTEVA